MSDIWIVKLKTIDNNNSEVEIDKNLTIKDLKQSIQAKTGAQPKSQRLIYKGKQLKDDHIIGQILAESGTIVHLLIKEEDTSEPNNNNSTHRNPTSNSSTGPNVNANPQMLGPDMIQNLVNNLINTTGAGLDTFEVTVINNNGINNSEQPQQSSGQQRPPMLNNIFSNIINSLRPPNQQQQGSNQQSQTQPNENTTSTRTTVPNRSEVPLNQGIQIGNETFDSFYASSNNILRNFNQFNHSSIPNFLSSDFTENSTLSIHDKVSRWLKQYTDTMSQFLPHLRQLSDMVDSERNLRSPQSRAAASQLLSNVIEGMHLASEATRETNRLVRSIKINENPGSLDVIPTQTHFNTTVVTTHMIIPSNNPLNVNQVDNSQQSNTNQNDSNNSRTQNEIPATNVGNTSQNQGSQFSQQLNQVLNNPSTMTLIQNLSSSLASQLDNEGGNPANLFNSLFSGLMSGGLPQPQPQSPPQPQPQQQPRSAQPQAERVIPPQQPVLLSQTLDNIISSTDTSKTTLHQLMARFNFDCSTFRYQEAFKVLGQLTLNEIKLLTKLDFKGLKRIRKALLKVAPINVELETLLNVLVENFAVHESEQQKLESNYDITSTLKEFVDAISPFFLNADLDDSDASLLFYQEIPNLFGEIYVELSRGLSNKSVGSKSVIRSGMENLLRGLVGEGFSKLLLEEFLKPSQIGNSYLEELAMSFVKIYFSRQDEAETIAETKQDNFKPEKQETVNISVPDFITVSDELFKLITENDKKRQAPKIERISSFYHETHKFNK